MSSSINHFYCSLPLFSFTSLSFFGYRSTVLFFPAGQVFIFVLRAAHCSTFPPLSRTVPILFRQPFTTIMIASLAALLGSAALASALPAFERETLASALIQPRTPSSTQLAPTLYTRQNTTLQAVPVARAGGVLNPQAAAAANVRDGTATRAFSATTFKAANGQCLFIDPLAGDFRQNLIPVQLKTCDGSANEKFDIITAGKHNNAANSMLVVSSLVRNTELLLITA